MSEPLTAEEIGDVVERGVVPCRQCRQPHDRRITQLRTKHQGPMTSWAAVDGHPYVKMSAEELLATLDAREGQGLDESDAADDEAANQWQAMMPNVSYPARVAVRLWNRVIVAERAAREPLDDDGRPPLEPETLAHDRAYMAGLIRGREIEREAATLAAAREPLDVREAAVNLLDHMRESSKGRDGGERLIVRKVDVTALRAVLWPDAAQQREGAGDGS